MFQIILDAMFIQDVDDQDSPQIKFIIQER